MCLPGGCASASCNAANWVSDSTGEPISPLKVSFTQTNFFDGTVSCDAAGISFEADFGHLLFNASPVLGTVAAPQIWSNLYAWDSPILYVSDFENSVQYLADGTFLQASTNNGITPISNATLQGLIQLGPTSTTASLPVPFTAGHLSIGSHVEFNVELPTNSGMILNQPSTLQNLIIDTGSSLQTLAGNNLSVNGSLLNSGELFLISPAQAQILTNAGQITIASAGSLASPSIFSNDGIIIFKVEVYWPTG